MARDPVKVSGDLDDNSLSNGLFSTITDGTEQLEINADGSANVTVNNGSGGSAVNIQDGGNSITVDGAVTVSATDLDIRNLSETTDQVLVFANTSADGSGTDLVPLVDASGHLQVDILSGGGSNASVIVDDAAFTPAVTSVTMSGAFVDETATDSVDEGDGGAFRMTADRKLLVRMVGATDANRLDVNASGQAQVEVAVALPSGTNNIGDVDVLTVPAPLSTTGGGTEATALRVTIASDSTGLLSIDDNGGSITVDSTDLDIRDLSASQDNVAISDGTDTLAVNTDGSINVVVAESSGTPVADYDPQADLAAATSDNHDYTASGGTFEPTTITVSSESIATFLIIANSVSISTLRTSVESPNATYTFPDGFTIANTQVLRVTRTNDSNKTKDVESTINGFQN